LAFTLFGEFLEEVEEFREAVGAKSATDLRHALKIHRRCQPSSTVEQKQMAATILTLLTSDFVQFEDWRDLVKPEEHNDAETIMKEYGSKVKSPPVSPGTGASQATITAPPAPSLYPPPGNTKHHSCRFNLNFELGKNFIR
jgi:Ca2+-transporting ATPase